MTLVPNAKRIALKAHSMWANYLGIACLVIPELLFVTTGRDLNPRWLWIVGILLILYGIGGRLKDQGISRSPAAVMALALLLSATGSLPINGGPVSEQAFLSVATPHVAQWEGKRNRAYQDIVGVWTICFGETRGVKPGDVKSDEECLDMLRAGLLEYRQGLHAYFTPETIRMRLTPHRDAAYVSLAYNAGIRGIGRSTATRRINAGDIAGGCEAMRWWNKAGGRVIRGLVNRRTAEYDMCMRGLRGA